MKRAPRRTRSGAALLAGLLWLATPPPALAHDHRTAQEPSTLSHGATIGAPFLLMTQERQPVTDKTFRGDWLLVFFGYTSCPDVCPTTLADLGKMSEQLVDLPAAHRPTVYFISVDPKRDTPAVLARYVRYFNADFVGVSGAPDQLRLLTHALGAAFSYDPPDQSGNYSVEHSSVVFLINPEAEEAAVFTSPIVPLRMADDYRIILTQHGDR